MHPVHFDYVPAPSDEKAKLALALYREALELENVAYRVFGLFKILNVVFMKPQDQIDWINSNIDILEVTQHKNKLEELRNTHNNIGEYFYTSLRCAVAHAWSEPLINPDDPADYVRLQRDGDLIQALIELLIEVELGVKRPHTIWKEHLYELEGFKEILGPSAMRIIGQIISGDEPPQELDIPVLPRMTMRLRDQAAFRFLEGMDATPESFERHGTVVIRLEALGGKVVCLLYLDFGEERLRIDISGGLAVYDDGTASVAKAAADILRFESGYLANGSLEIWNDDANCLLGRCDPFIPVNIDLTRSCENLYRQAEHFDKLACEREGGNTS
jgi:hypothetical protein